MRYAILFRAELLHDYFLNVGAVPAEVLQPALAANVRRHYAAAGPFVLTPTQDTRRQLAGRRMIFRATAQGCAVFVAVTDADPSVPLVALGAQLRLRFALEVREPSFFNYTALSLRGERFYFFSNDSGNRAGDGRFLSVPIPPFESLRAYAAGDVRSAPAASGVDCFVALRDTGPSAAPVAAHWRRIPPDTFSVTTGYARGDLVLAGNRVFRARVNTPQPDLADASQWEGLETLGNQCVTPLDSLRLVSDVLELDLSAGATPDALVEVLRGSDVVQSQALQAPSGNLAGVHVDVSGLEPGRYRVVTRTLAGTPIASASLSFYVERQAVAQGWLGVVEIGLGAGGLELLDAAGTLTSPLLSLRFLNRTTRWRYIFPAPQPVGVGAEVVGDGDPNALVSASAHPLTHFGSGLVLQSDNPATTTTFELVRLPRPEPTAVRYASAEWVSDVHSFNLQL